MSEFGWLDGAGKKPAAARKSQQISVSRARRPKALIMADRKLTPEQRLYKRFLVETETVGAANRRMKDAGFQRDRATLYRWRTTPTFAEALQLEQDYMLKCAGIDKARLLNDAQKIKEIALTPKPILYKGAPTGFSDVELGSAMRAVEFQGKAIGLFGDETNRVQVNIDIDFSGRIDNGPDDAIDGEAETLSVE